MNRDEKLEALKKMLLNENLENDKIEKIEKGLVCCDIQLTDLKKLNNGYLLEDSVIDVIQGGYAVSVGDNHLFTYGIEPCCAVVIVSPSKKILFHLDGTFSVFDVKRKADSLGFGNNSKVFIFPGVTCGIPGSFKYDELMELYASYGYDVMVRRINGTFGYVKVSADEIIAGSLLQKGDEITFKFDDKKNKR